MREQREKERAKKAKLANHELLCRMESELIEERARCEEQKQIVRVYEVEIQRLEKVNLQPYQQVYQLQEELHRKNELIAEKEDIIQHLQKHLHARPWT